MRRRGARQANHSCAVHGILASQCGTFASPHALSAALGKNCKLFNAVTPDPVCKDKPVAETNVMLSRGPAADLHAQPAAQATLEAPEIATAATEKSN
jgi:hypothetical protein